VWNPEPVTTASAASYISFYIPSVMRDMERYYGASKATGDIIGFAIDEMILKVKFRKIDLLEGVDL